MDWSEDDIKRGISDKKVSAITLDTSVFDGNGNRFEHGLLARLRQFKLTEVGVVLSDVVAGEVRKHVAQEAAEAKSKVTAALKEVGKAWQVSREQRSGVLETLFDDESPDELAARRFDAFMESVGAAVVKAEGRVDVSRMLTAYFAGEPPFGKSANKKNEFPDAIALQALEHWATKDGTVLLVVSKDGDWKRFAKASKSLVVVDDLALALSYFHQNANVACARLASRVADGELDITDAIWDAIKEAVDRSVVVPEIISGYHFDADIDDVRVTDVELDEIAYFAGPFRVIDKPSDTVLVVEAEVEAEIEVSATINFSVTDAFDKDEVPIGSTYATTTANRRFHVLLTFEGDLANDAELVEAEVSTEGRNVYLTVPFGEVGPDWGDDAEEEAD